MERKNFASVMDDQGKPEWKREGDGVVGEGEEKKRKREDYVAGEREEKEGPSQVLPPASDCDSDSASDRDSDSASDRDSDSASDGDWDSDSDDFLLDVPGPDDYPREDSLDEDKLMKYYQEIKESEGFDIYNYPGRSLLASIVPIEGIKENPELYEDVVGLAKLAIKRYNIDHNEAYEFYDLEKVNSCVVQGLIFYITFQVNNLKAADNGNRNVDGDDAPLETFQAIVWEGITKTKVELCRPKPIKLQN